jgi:hypothetical protein
MHKTYDYRVTKKSEKVIRSCSFYWHSLTLSKK